MKTSLQESIHNKYVGYIRQWTVYAKDIGKTKFHQVLDFLRIIFDKGAVYSTMDNEKCKVAIILHILANPIKNKHPMVMKYLTGIFNLRLAKPKLGNAQAIKILSNVLSNIYLSTLKDQTLFPQI